MSTAAEHGNPSGCDLEIDSQNVDEPKFPEIYSGPSFASTCFDEPPYPKVYSDPSFESSDWSESEFSAENGVGASVTVDAAGATWIPFLTWRGKGDNLHAYVYHSVPSIGAPPPEITLDGPDLTK